MLMEENYIKILEESLIQKIKVLDEIKEISEEQMRAIGEDSFKIEDLDSFIERKGTLIEKLEKLDEGFETLYENVSETLKDNREKYSAEIKRMQDMIREITEKSNAIQVIELRNKNDLNNYFGKRRAEVKEGRMNSKVAMNYYKSQRNGGLSDSYFMDSKK